MRINTCILVITALITYVPAQSQQILQTGGQKMPDEWIDKSTGHKLIRLSRKEGSNVSFYFHNNPFIGNKMVFYSSSHEKAGDVTDMKKQEADVGNIKDKQLFTVDLNTLAIEQLTHHQAPMNGEIVSAKTKRVFFQVKDSVYAVNVETKKEQLVFVFPAAFKGDITTVNADGSLLGGAKGSDAEKEIYQRFPAKSDFFTKIYEAHLPRTLFTINIKTGKLTKVFTDSAWLNHVQFSPTDPSLLMFCHEGPWHKVNRIWTIYLTTKKITLMHKRTMDMEIAGHEWFSANGKTIWFDLQQPKGETFFVAGTNLATGKETKYKVERNDWSVHYTSSADEKLFAGDGGDPGAVAKAKDGQWINLFKPRGDGFETEKLVNMQYHKYKLEPNVHFSPDGKWVIFRANFEGVEEVYAVEVAKSDKL